MLERESRREHGLNTHDRPQNSPQSRGHELNLYDAQDAFPSTGDGAGTPAASPRGDRRRALVIPLAGTTATPLSAGPAVTFPGCG